MTLHETQEALHAAQARARSATRVAAESMRLLDEHGLLPELRHRLDALEGGEDAEPDIGPDGGGDSAGSAGD